MQMFSVEVANDALILPVELIEQLGWRESTKILIQKHNGTVAIRPKVLTADEIADRACVYLIKHVGDATAVKLPVREGGNWRVEVVLSYRPETIGFLTFSSDGRLIESESDSPAKLKGIERR